jgi:hypothetical protein
MAQVSAGQDGIQKLLAAEKEAQEIVAKARKGAFTISNETNPRIIIDRIFIR